MYAAYYDHEEMVRFLLQHHANLEMYSLYDQNTTLMWAMVRGNTNIAKILVQHGANVNTQNKSGYTPLIIAAKHGNMKAYYDIFIQLLKNHAEVNKKDANEWTALIHACKTENNPAIEELLRYHADVNAHSNNGLTPLIIATQNGNVHNIKKLLHQGAIVLEKGSSYSILDIAWNQGWEIYLLLNLLK
jgi:ankyrin repeat protein